MSVAEEHEVEHLPLTEDVVALLATPEERIEGRLKVTGRARYASDARQPGMLWAGFARSPFAHARIVSVDTSAAEALPGVQAVITGADVRGARFGRKFLDYPVLAWDKALFIGDRVAAVAAESSEIADRAVELIKVEYEELPAVFDPEEALATDAPILHEQIAGYGVLGGGQRPPVPHPNHQGYFVVRKEDEDLEARFASAFRVFEHTFHTPRQHQAYMEPHACLVWLDGERVNVISTNKSPFSLRQQMAAAFGIPANTIAVDAAFIGGDFGGKGLSIDEFACYALAKKSGRPVKAVMRYVDELLAANPRHETTIRLRTAVDQEGRFVAHEAWTTFNGGAYGAGKPAISLAPGNGAATLSAYRVPHSRMHYQIVYTNAVPGGHMRSPAEVQAIFASESHVDEMAHALGIDPLEFRRRNALRPGDIGPANERFREVRATEVLDALGRETNWAKAPLPAGRGRGIALGVRHVGGGKTSIVMRLLRDGTIEVLTGAPDQGSGSFTVMQRVAAATLGVKLSRVRVIYGNTAEAPQDPGAGGSRVTHVAGRAVTSGARKLKSRLEDLAAEVMGWPAGEVRLEHDQFTVGDGSSYVADFDEVAQRIVTGSPVEEVGAYDGVHGPTEPADFNFAGCMAEVEVDRDTGQVTVREMVMAVDVGTVINPVAHRGQIEGGIIYGLGGALMEYLPVEDGKVTTLSLGEYKIPTEEDVPPLRLVYLPTEIGPGPFGAKMAGEVSNSTVAPAIANAVAAAVGARVTSLPITSERVLEALE